MLGVPTIADRVAQTVVAGELMSRVEAIFHDDSYGYRPGRSALDAVGRPRGMRAKNGRMFVSFSPAISRDALTKSGREVRSWRLHRHIGHSFGDLARRVNPIVRGLDAVLRRVLPVGNACPPDAHQRLPDALGPQEIPPVQGTTPAPAGMAAGHRRVPAVLRALGLDHRRPRRLVIKMTRAV